MLFELSVFRIEFMIISAYHGLAEYVANLFNGLPPFRQHQKAGDDQSDRSDFRRCYRFFQNDERRQIDADESQRRKGVRYAEAHLGQ